MPAFVPKYARVMRAICDDIDASKLRPGDRLPSTGDLADLHRVSRGTVRKAVTLLIEDGVLYGRNGVGVFVAGSRRG